MYAAFARQMASILFSLLISDSLSVRRVVGIEDEEEEEEEEEKEGGIEEEEEEGMEEDEEDVEDGLGEGIVTTSSLPISRTFPPIMKSCSVLLCLIVSKYISLAVLEKE